MVRSSKLRPAMTAFMIYVALNERNIRKEDISASDFDVGKKLFEKWKALTEDERNTYIVLSQKDQNARKQAKEYLLKSN